MKQKENARIITGEFLRLLPLQILITMIMSLNGIIDGVVASNALGQSAMAAVGLFNPIAKIIDTVTVVMVAGTQILCGQYMGRNRADRVTGLLTVNLAAVTGVGLLLSAVCLAIPRQLAMGLGADDALAAELADYIRGAAPGFAAAMLASQLSAFLQLQHREKDTYVAILAMAAANVALDLLFVSRLGLGMVGLAAATTLANWLFLGMLAAFLLRDGAGQYLDVKKLKLADLKDIVRIGLPGALVQFCQTLRGLSLNYLIVHRIGSLGAAAFAAVGTFGGIMFSVTSGIAAAVRILVSLYQGEEDRTSLIQVMKTAVKYGTLLNLGSFVLIAALSAPMTRIFFRPEEGLLFASTRMGFVMFAFSMILSGIYLTMSNYHQCFARFGLVNLLSVMDGFLGVTAVSWLLVPRFSMDGIWWGQVLNGVITLVILYGYAILKKKAFPRSVEDLMVFPEQFGAAGSDRMDLSVCTMEEVMGVSLGVEAFCRSHGVDDRRTYYASLAMEEMAGNIVTHGFGDGKKHSVDIRVIYTPEKLLLRMRDDGRPFDPVACGKLFSPEDPARNIGIRMMERTASRMEYHNLLGLNVLTIELK